MKPRDLWRDGLNSRCLNAYDSIAIYSKPTSKHSKEKQGIREIIMETKNSSAKTGNTKSDKGESSIA